MATWELKLEIPAKKCVVEYKDLPLAQHYSFIIDIDVTDACRRLRLGGRTNNLSLFGCGVNNIEALSEGNEDQD